MSEEHQSHKPPAMYTYATGAGLGLLIGGAFGLFKDHFLLDAGFGIAIGLVVSYILRTLKS